MQKGLVHVYTGDGKGKTTAATGVIVRSLGQGQSVLLARFLKPENPESGEIRFLHQQPGIRIITAGVGIIGQRPDRETVAGSVRETLAEASRLMATGEYDLTVLDEINNALHNGYIASDAVVDFIRKRPQHVNLILTGRNASTEVQMLADLVTSMEKIKHPYDQGVPARPGLDY